MIVVDRIEGEVAVLEIDGATVEIPAAALPAGAGEGAVLALTLDPDAQGDVASQARERLDRLKGRGPKKGSTLVL